MSALPCTAVDPTATMRACRGSQTPPSAWKLLLPGSRSPRRAATASGESALMYLERNADLYREAPGKGVSAVRCWWPTSAGRGQTLISCA